jgi:hypothetical protein
MALHVKDTALLEKFRDTLGVGSVNKTGKPIVVYRVESIKDLDIIIHHFERYPLATVKTLDYSIFKQCFEMIKRGEHLTEDGIVKIAGLKTFLNRGLSEDLAKVFPNIVPMPKPNFVFKGIPHPLWLSGFVSGDGSFNLKISSLASTSIGVRIQLRFGIGLHLREVDVIRGIASYFNFSPPIEFQASDGSTSIKYMSITSKSVVLSITNFSYIVDYIIPFFKKYPVQGQKALDFEDFTTVAEIMKKKEHLTTEGMASILRIKEGMNQNRPW